jgi:excisionase family DNA binding protein
MVNLANSIMAIPSIKQLEQPLSDYHQFIFEINRMMSLPPDQDINDPGLPLRYRFKESPNENPEIVELVQRIREITDSLDEFLLLSVIDYWPKSKILQSIYLKLKSEKALGDELLEYVKSLSAQQNDEIPPEKFLHAGSGKSAAFAVYYRAMANMQEAVSAFEQKLKEVITFLRKHSQVADQSGINEGSKPRTDKKELLQEPYLTKREAAALLAVSEDTIDNYIKKGLLTKMQIPGKQKISIPTEDVKKMLPG